MSKSIDERVVEMKFNNADFKAKAAATIAQLAELKNKLNFDGARKGWDDIKAGAAGVNLGPLGQSVSGLADKFSALKVAGIAALATLASQATMYGQRLLAGMTEGITSGFQEYELKMGSIQTILANTAKDNTNLQQVSASLNELNTYADKTIYNFGDMTKNIGLFTNAGIKLQDATSMIKGFSNEAAASGTSAEGAAGAAYQLSQALSAGTIRLMDWRSLQNVGMGNKNMQRGIIEIAQAMGTFTNSGASAESATKDFNGSLEKGWLSADVMSNYLKIMAGDMDVATQKSLGLSDATIETFSKQQKMSEDAATKVRTFTALVGTIKESVGSGWATSAELVLGNFDQATELFTKINDTVGVMIGKMGDARNKLLGDWNKLGGRDVAIDALTNAGKALMSVLTPIKQAFRDIFPPMTGKQLLAITEAVRDFTKGLILNKAQMDGVKATFRGFFSILDIGWQILKGFLGIIGRVLGAFAGGGSGILTVTGSLGGFVTKIHDVLVNGGLLEKFFNVLGDVVTAPIAGLKLLGQAFLKLFGLVGKIDLSGLSDVFARLGEHLQSLAVVGDWFVKAWQKVVDVFQAVYKWAQPFLQETGRVFGQIGKAIVDGMKQGDFSTAFDFINVLLTTGIFLVIRNFFKKLGSLFGGKGGEGGGIFSSIKEVFGGLTDTLSAMQSQIKSKTLLTIAIAVGVLTASVVALSMIDTKRLTAALVAITVMFGQLAATSAAFSKISGLGGFAKIPLIAGGMIVLGAAVLVLSSAVKTLADLDWNGLAKGLTGVGVILGMLVASAKLFKGTGPGMFAAATSMVVLAAAVKILASATKDFAGLNWDEIGRGLIGVGSVLAAVVIFNKLSAANKGAAIAGINILLLASAMKLFASAVQDFSSFDLGALTQGLVGVGATLGLLVGFTKAAGNPAGLIRTSGALILLGAAMKVFASAMKDFTKFSWDQIGRGLVTMGGALALVVGAMMLIPPNMLLSAAALVVVGAALKIIAGAFKDMAGNSWDEIGRGFTVLAGSLVLLAAAMYAMTGSLPGAAALIVAAQAIAIFAPAFVLLSNIEWGAIGQGLGALGLSLAILAVGGVALIPAMPGLIGLGVAIGLIGVGVGVAAAGLGLLALGLVALGTSGPLAATGITAIATAILNLLPLAMQKLGEGIVAFADVIGNSGPQLVAAFVALITSMLDGINQVAPKILDTMVSLLLDLLKRIDDNMPKFVDRGMSILIKFLDGVNKKLPALIDAGTTTVIRFIEGVGRSAGRLAEAGADTIIKFVNSLARTIETRSADMRAAGARLGFAIVDGMTGGLASKAQAIASKAWELGKKAINAIAGAIDSHSPSKETYKLGGYFGDGFANAISDGSRKVEKRAAGMGNGAVTAMAKSLDAANKTMNANSGLTPVIRPTVDLTEVKKGTAAIQSMGNGLVATPSLKTSLTENSALAAQQKYASPQLLAAFQELADSLRDQPVQGDVNFYQTNTSPKALSTTEIYRQTRTQLSGAKAVIGQNA